MYIPMLKNFKEFHVEREWSSYYPRTNNKKTLSTIAVKEQKNTLQVTTI